MKLNQKGVVHLLIPALLIAAIIAGVFLITNGNPLKLFSKASSEQTDIEWVVSDGDSNNCVIVKDGKKVTTCPTVKFKVNLPTDNNSTKSEVKLDETDFAVSETRDFTGKFFQDYVSGVGVYHTFENPTAGQNFIFVQFRDSKGEIVKIDGEDYITDSIRLVSSAVEKPIKGGSGPSIKYTCTVGKICTCGDTSKGDSRDPGKCSDCDGGWCNEGQCYSCGSNKSFSEVLCPADVKTCPDGTYVLRDPENGCQFKVCGADSLISLCIQGKTECDCGYGNSKDPGKCDQCGGGWCKSDSLSSKGGICVTCRR